MELLVVVSAVVLSVAAVLFLGFKAFRLVPCGKDERGLSTLEWMLIVAAVGGLATLGVLIVRSSLGSPDDMEDTVDDPTVMAARDSVSGITNRGACEASDAGGHMGVTARWNADTQECEIVRGANVIAANEDLIRTRIQDALTNVDTSSRDDDTTRGCTEAENADGFFPLNFRAGSALTVADPSWTSCTGGKWDDAATGFSGYTFKSASVVSAIRCYTEGTGDGTVCGEDPNSAGSTLTLSNNDGGRLAQGAPSAGDPTPLASRRDVGTGEDIDITLAAAVGLTDDGSSVLCSSEGTAPANPCELGTTVPHGLYKVKIKITLEKTGSPDKTYFVTDYLYART